jgi:putative Mg2+ transporter-C (MgtC) family protein
VISLGTVILRLCLALVLGAVVGIERRRGERAAGIRTLALVSVGSALIIIVSAYGFTDVLGLSNRISFDPSRVAAQVVSGIGFLGAGTILLRKEIIRGLTTAAAIWVVAGIGLACGSGLLWEAVIATALALIILAVLHPLERRFFPGRRPHALRLRVSSREAAGGVVSEVQRVCGELGIALEAIELRGTGDGVAIEVRCRLAEPGALVRAAGQLQAVPAVSAVRVSLIGERPR